MAQLWYILGLSLLVYMAAAWGAGKLLGLSETDFYILYAALCAIGVIAAGVFAWWKLRKEENAAAEGAEDAGFDSDDEIDAIMKEASGKLAASQIAKNANVATLPVV